MARIIYQTEYELEEMQSAGIDFNQVLRIIKGFMGTDDTLDALKVLRSVTRKRKLKLTETDDYDFDHEWRYEVYSYNLLVEGFGKLFAPKEVHCVMNYEKVVLEGPEVFGGGPINH